MRKGIIGMTLIELLIILAIALIFCLILFPTGSFVNESVAINALENLGFSEIKVVDKAVWFIRFRGGDKDDAVRFTCEATNPAGKRVVIYVFSGWLFKAATVRSLE